jgi:hypothetical protein
MLASSVVSAVLWAVALAATVWILVPAIAFALGVGGYRTDVLPDVGPPAVPGGDAELDPMLRGLAALGFRAAGRTLTTGRFTSPALWRWRQLGTTLWLVDPDRRTYATLYRLVPDEPMRISLITMFDDGGFARTSCPGVAAKDHWRSDYRRQDLRGAGADEIVARHQEQVDTYARERGTGPRAVTIAELTAAENAAERPLVRKLAASGYSLTAIFLAGLSMMFPLIVVPLIATGHHRQPWPSWFIPLVLCSFAGVYALMRWLVHGPLLRYNARRTHTEDLSGQPDDVADDGTILAMGKNERRLRVLAGAAALLSSTWLVALVGGLVHTHFRGSAAAFMLLPYGALAVFAILHSVGRARGKLAFAAKRRRDPSAVWVFVMLVSVLFWSRLDWSRGAFHQALYVVAVLSMLIAMVGVRLERKRGQ